MPSQWAALGNALLANGALCSLAGVPPLPLPETGPGTALAAAVGTGSTGTTGEGRRWGVRLTAPAALPLAKANIPYCYR
jgi:hypothetical protein